MTRTELIAAVAASTGQSKATVRKILSEGCAQIQAAVLHGDTVRMPGFGNYALKRTPARKARMGRNPATGEAMKIKAKPAGRKIVFRVAKAWKDQL